jgi:hypothetical protein
VRGFDGGGRSYKEVLLTPARPPERVKKRDMRRNMANRNQARYKEQRRRREDRSGRERGQELGLEEGKWRCESHPHIAAAEDDQYSVAGESDGDGHDDGDVDQYM